MRRRIEIRNETRYRTADLRRIMVAAAREVFAAGTKPIIRARIVYARRGRVTGCASLGGTMMTLRIGRGVTDSRRIAALVVHEMGHLRGVDHPKMRGNSWWTWRGYPRGTADVSERWYRAHEWARGMTVAEEEPKKRPRLSGVELAEARRERTVAALERWSRKAKRAATAIKKLRARLRYYDTRLAAMGGRREA